jgi:mRNA-degrading endonuclease toxin of MazEF toxin-antitoxin module
VNRGDVALLFCSFASGAGGKRRPGLAVQNDADNSRLAATIVAQITRMVRSRINDSSNLTRRPP